MRRRLVAVSLLSVIVASVATTAAATRSAYRDLDAMSDAELRRDLIAELDDIDFPPDEQHALGELREAILDALADEGDDEGDDAGEAEIDLSDLEAEMEEAELALEEVVDAALLRADELVRRDEPAPLVLATETGAHTWGYAGLIVASQSRNARRGFTSTRVAIQQTTNGIIAGVRRAR
ncbi:MAG: hypothetical protein AB1762_00360 [Gemmatimonadota bacterium]